MTHVSQATRRARRVRKIRMVVAGTAARPRLSVQRTAKHFRAQLIDDAAGRTLAYATDDMVGTKDTGIKQATAVGERLAEQAKAANITAAVFDRRGYRYHGRVAAFAAAARAGGLQF